MNAAFLLVTTSWLAAADAAPTKPDDKAATTTSASCCGDACGCENVGQRLLGKLRGLFSRNRCCDNCGAATCCAAPKVSCCRAAPKCCHAAPKCKASCDSCCESRGQRLLSKLRGLFNRGGCCDTCGAATTTTGKPDPKGGDMGDKMPKGNEPPLKPVGLDSVPTVVPNVTVETGKSPF